MPICFINEVLYFDILILKHIHMKPKTKMSLTILLKNIKKTLKELPKACSYAIHR
ncbi:hypothetical protein SAMN05421766_1185 [Zobellia uliginosa]|uniref:Uncharacterized protein n=1 Tax=Zobellia uliginosa TaxID=143224 RepID=A0ABY1L2C3_9FLAO|nr:hypothetical protein SAMN05421766_1185 [Zobellia uliginosa]